MAENPEKTENCDLVEKADEEQMEVTAEAEEKEPEKVRGRQMGQKNPWFWSESGSGSQLIIDIRKF